MNSSKKSYTAKLPDQDNWVSYTAQENKIWSTLLNRQLPLLKEKACAEYLYGLELLQLPLDRIPQCADITSILRKHTSWILTPVTSVLPIKEFFYLLANRKFPAATFIRSPEDLDYINEPDIFHEIIGHCPMLTNQRFADFLQAFAQVSLNAPPSMQKYLGRLFFFTMEIGLIRTSNGLKIYGGGILSSKKESLYALDSAIPERRAFNLQEVLHTPYDLEQMQKIYYAIDSFTALYQLLETDLSLLINSS